jgi:hypothetical protein
MCWSGAVCLFVLNVPSLLVVSKIKKSMMTLHEAEKMVFCSLTQGMGEGRQRERKGKDYMLQACTTESRLAGEVS